jgi:2-polyprenyl-3-methyl-5-hydroxy-6-metoxy-1,4-benzoquinol methylase
MNRFAEHDCPLCKTSNEHQKIKSKVVYGGQSDQLFYQCTSCDVIYLYPPTTIDDDVQFYENEFDKWMVKRSGDDAWTDPALQFQKMQKRELPLRLPYLKKIVQPGSRVLEIGSSSGFMLKALQEHGCDCVGVELSPTYAEYSCRQGLRTYPNLQELDKGETKPFDVVLHYYVLEHVSKPLYFLDSCIGYLGAGGRMMFEVPNGNDPLTALYKIDAFNAFYWWRAHHWYFTPKSLSYLLNQTGKAYEIFPGQRYDLSNHIHWMLTGQPGGMGKYSHIFSSGTERAYAEDLKRTGFYDYMIGIVE